MDQQFVAKCVRFYTQKDMSEKGVFVHQNAGLTVGTMPTADTPELASMDGGHVSLVFGGDVPFPTLDIGATYILSLTKVEDGFTFTPKEDPDGGTD